MKLSDVKKFLIEDFKEQRTWIQKLLNPLNRFLEDVTVILNGGITLGDNLKQQMFLGELGAGKTEFIFRWNLNQAPTGVIILSAKEVGSSSVPAIGLSWTYDNGVISVSLTGLNALKEYKILTLAMV